MPGYATTVLCYLAIGQSVSKGRDTSFRDASSKGRIVQGKRLPSDASFKGCIILRTHSKIRDGTRRDTLLRDTSFHHHSFYKRELFSIGKLFQFLPDFVNFSIRVDNTLFHFIPTLRQLTQPMAFLYLRLSFICVSDGSFACFSNGGGCFFILAIKPDFNRHS
jgi:hypothetical protein